MWDSLEKLLNFLGGISKGDAVVAGIGGGLLFGVRKLWRIWRRKDDQRDRIWKMGAARRLWDLEERVAALGALEGRFQSLSGRVGEMMSEVHDIKLEGATVRVLLERLIKERNRHTEELKVVLEDLTEKVATNRVRPSSEEIEES